EEERQTHVAFFSRSSRQDRVKRSNTTVGGEAFRSTDDVFVAVSRGGGFDRCNVGSTGGLGHQISHQFAIVPDPGKYPIPDLRADSVNDGERSHGLDNQQQGGRRAESGYLFNRNAQGSTSVLLEAPELRRQSEGQQTQIPAECFDIPVEFSGLVD